ncbi:MAG: phosphoadenosine phosphosulfate reductase family protein [Gammaproteobacteria bacterium]|nr:phosphoadenosine phosphosulfate reductase family protein [Gammaproteobacteria bacterium]MYA66901.1 phosphoadenosine phosphosulfate reductase family protein [Gammaproteobacteria bacterium]MYH46614.1 phosphoadenosine phosphosulfate reductase family protein [Gammaproteobacteria bacterium]MYL13644.1 phosphoadenosine phosphosulfate reductase family protein [Gammaproteobacteria bacterium]
MTRHILSLSGGKDSAALAIYMRDRIPEMEYVFSDTRKELPETYEYLERVENYLGVRVHRLNADFGFDHWYDVYGGMIPSNHRRWCTKMLKLRPFEEFVGDDPVINYVGLRADENRGGYISHKPNIKAVYPFQEDGLKLADVKEILLNSGVGLPPYTQWGRTRSGCFFCFYQRKIEWVRLKEEHPELFEQAKAYEKPYEPSGKTFTWSEKESLEELERPERMAAIKREHELRVARKRELRENLTLVEVFGDEAPEEDNEGCLICSL